MISPLRQDNFTDFFRTAVDIATGKRCRPDITSGISPHPFYPLDRIACCLHGGGNASACSKSMDQPGKVANSARGQLNRENEYFAVRVRA